MVTKSHKMALGLAIALVSMFVLFFGPSLIAAQNVSTSSTEIELVGPIEAMTLDTITVNSQVIDVSAAEINTPLEVGAVVKVQGSMGADGKIVAREVNAPDATDSMLPGEVEIVGLLSAFEGSSMTIGGISFDVSQAEVKAGVVVGEVVKVHAALNNGVWVAREVELAAESADNNSNDNNLNDNNVNVNDNNANDNGDDNGNDNAANFNEGEIELRGTLTSVSDSSIVVSGQTISIVGAEIKDSLVVGALVKVHASMVDGQLVAREVELAGNNNNHQGNEDGAVVIPADCQAAQPAGWTTYTIQAGDTLSDIADRTDSRVSELALANCISDPRFIVVGLTLFVPQAPVASDNHNNNDNNLNDNGDDHGGDNNNDNGNDNNDNGDDHGGDSGHGGDNNNDNGDDHGGSGHG